MKGDDFVPKKRVTKNDKKQKREVYSQRHIRTILKHLGGKLTNAPESGSTYQEGIRTPEVQGMAKTKRTHAHSK